LALERIDSYPYRHRVRDVMASPAVVLPGEADTREALRALIDKGISSVLVRRSDGVFGIVTERDVLRALARAGATGTTEPLAALMRHPLTTVGQDDFVYRAIARMDRLGIRHLPVDDGYGRIVGMVTPRNLLRQRAGAAFALGDVMDSASDVTELGNAWSRLPATAESLMAEEVDPRDVAAVISSELGALTARAARMAEQRLAAAGQGEPPCRYAVLVLGSGGRGESLLAADQDNAVVYEHGEPDGPEDRYFAALGGHMADILDQVGVPYCKGGVMARNAAWRHDVAGWKALAASWIRGSKPEDLLNIDIFFDAQCVHGDAALADSVLAHARAIARSAPLFLKLMTDLARDWQAPFGLFGGIRTDEKGRVDLKKGGIMPIFTGARVLAIKHGVAERATPARLAAVRDLGIGEASEMTAVIEAHRKLLGFILEQQLADIRAGIPASNRVELARLSKIRQAELKAALKQVGVLTGILGEGRL
jgi:DNA polymerase-3 subunit epsilon/CBS domain-containing protein